jgi:hypothetical protein
MRRLLIICGRRKRSSQRKFNRKERIERKEKIGVIARSESDEAIQKKLTTKNTKGNGLGGDGALWILRLRYAPRRMTIIFLRAFA